jgi:ATP-dependent Clp protease ATP-binding subunit ClpC
MFERCTEKARRVIFFARYEASQHGMSEIDTRCLLLGLIRESKDLMACLLRGGSAEIAGLLAGVEALFPEAVQQIATSVNPPLNQAAKQALAYAAEESWKLDHKSIDPRHLLLGLLRVGGPETACLKARGIELDRVRAESFEGVNLDKYAPGHEPDRFVARAEYLRVLHEIPPERQAAALALLQALASGKFEVTGTGRNGPFQFSFDE